MIFFLKSIQDSISHNKQLDIDASITSIFNINTYNFNCNFVYKMYFIHLYMIDTYCQHNQYNHLLTYSLSPEFHSRTGEPSCVKYQFTYLMVDLHIPRSHFANLTDLNHSGEY